MRKEAKPKKDIVEKDVNVLKEEVVGGGKLKMVLRTVRWCVGGKDGQLLLEKRAYNYNQGKDAWIMSKAKGFTKADMDFVVGLWPELSLNF